jgi:hypothetical protein
MVNRNSDGSYSAFHCGALRPIVVEADSWPKALLILAEALHEQEAEEYAFFESMTARSLSLYGDPKQ